MDFFDRSIVLVGMMGSGKSRVGSDLAKLTGLPFVDSDSELERAAGMTAASIFEQFGEPEFRAAERKVMLRLLDGPPHVISSGGGSFIQEPIRQAVKEKAISVWLKAELDTLVARLSRSSHRPLLRGHDLPKRLREMMDLRYPVYAEADIAVTSDRQTPRAMARCILRELEAYKKRAME